MQYGDVGLSQANLSQYIGTNDNYTTFVDEDSLWSPTNAIDQRDADLIHFWEKVGFSIPTLLISRLIFLQ